jgi:hypothetical protein
MKKSMRAATLIAVASAAVALLTSPSSGGSPSKGREDVGFSSSTAIRDALNKAGIACTEYQTVASGDREMFTESAADVGSCKVENEDISLIVWKDNGQRDNWSGMAKNIGCQMVKILGESTLDYVDGDRWTIENPSQTLAKKISDAIGGKAVHIVCSG